MGFSEQLNFLKEWVTDPLRVGAVAPSSDSLAEIITREIEVEHAPVVELGPGTGVFTRSLLDRGIPQHKLVLVESSLEFARLLDERFPDARMFCMDAAELDQVDLCGGQKAGAVISGLPLFSMPNWKVADILRSTFSHLRPGGYFYQFTYGPKCPVASEVLDACGIQARRVGGTLRNMPPASVYKLSRANAAVA